MSEKSIYDLKLHETTSFKQCANIITHVLRVPGGWLYRTVRLGHERTQMTEVFVPYDVDLIPKKDYINQRPGPEKILTHTYLRNTDASSRLLGVLAPANPYKFRDITLCESVTLEELSRHPIKSYRTLRGFGKICYWELHDLLHKHNLL